MPVFKCKSCGGEIRAEEGQSVAVCEYCQREQSLSKSKSEVVVNLFNRANSLRLKSEFDKSQEIYERILTEEPDDAEAHWGIVLCKYGIEYVKENEQTYSKIPTCHRTQYESILADADYLAAIENADVLQKACYESEAKKIAELQKNILDVVRNEKPFDVFICYKEKDEYGNRTVDSGIANDIYYQLTQEGFKVFYAAITLEDKLGTAYEPYIFAALNSAKVMLVLGTKPEYFNAVWVKNEWARYLKIIKNDRNRLLIPCYRNMDAYELPEEFAHLQAQDMSKVGFITDIIRGIKKIIPKENKINTYANSFNISTANTAAPILKRVFLCLEDKDFQKAESLLEQVFNLDPECAEAYIAKMMIERKLTTREALYSLDFDLKDDPIYMRALRFADENYKAVLDEFRNESIYRKANNYFEQNTIEKYNAAKSLYDKIIEYKDSSVKRESCDSGISEINYQKALRLKREADNFNDIVRTEQADEIFRKLGEYKDSKAQIEECIELKKTIQYKNAVEAKRLAANSKDANTVSKHYNNAISLFSESADYKDSIAQAAECEQLKTEALYNIACSVKASASENNDASLYDNASMIFGQISGYKDSAEQKAECKEKAEAANADAIYRKATELSKKDDIQALNDAINFFVQISEWKDSKSKITETTDKLEALKAEISRKKTVNDLLDEQKQIISEIEKSSTVVCIYKKLKCKKTFYRLSMLICVLMIFVLSVLFSMISNEEQTINTSREISLFFGVFIPFLFPIIATVTEDGWINILKLFIPIYGYFLLLSGIFVSLYRIFVPLSKDEQKMLKEYKSSNKNTDLLLKQKTDIEKKLISIANKDELKIMSLSKVNAASASKIPLNLKRWSYKWIFAEVALCIVSIICCIVL